jgi:hypothetical protein
VGGCASDIEPMAVLGLAWLDKMPQPFCLTLQQAHLLVREMIEVINSLDRRRDSELGYAAIDTFHLPPTPSVPTAIIKNRKAVRPSRRPSSPYGPIQATEAWQLHSLLKNVKSHEDFLKFIGAEAVDAIPSQAALAQRPTPAVLKPKVTAQKRPKPKR